MLLMSILISSTAFASDYEKVWYWENSAAPDIVVCEDSKTTIKIVNESVSFWKEKGYNFGSVYKNEKICKKTWHYGTVILRGSSGLDTEVYNAYTTPWFSNASGNLVSAVIQVDTVVANEQELITHELGHALGLGHVSNQSDVMYEYRNY